jgi:hypothetical protein
VRARNAPGAVASLVCGIVGVCLLPAFSGGIVSVLLGATAIASALHARTMIDRSPTHRFTGQGMATAGLVLGIIDVTVGAAVFLFLLFLL